MTGAGVARVRCEVDADVRRVWDVVTDWPRHGRHVWATTIEVRGPVGVGQVFLATTAIGPVRLEDPMEVTVWQPPADGPGHVRLEKRGRVLTGWAEIDVRPLGPGRCELIWREEIVARGAGSRSVLAPVEQRLSGLSTRLMIARMARRLGREAATSTDG